MLQSPQVSQALFLEGDPYESERILDSISSCGSPLEVRAVSAAPELWQALQATPADIIIINNSFRGLHSVDPIGLCSELGKGAPIIVLAGRFSDAEAERAIDAGAFDYIALGELHRLPMAIRRALQYGRMAFDKASAAERGAQEVQVANLVLESLRDYALVVANPRGEILSWHPGAARLYGYSAEEAVGKPLSILYAGERPAEALHDQCLKAFFFGASSEEAEHIRRDGGRFWASASLFPLRAPQSGMQGYTLLARDITEERRARLALAESEAFFSQAQDVARIGSWSRMLGSEGKLVWSRATMEIFGITPAEFTGAVTLFDSLVHPEDLPRVKAAAASAVAKGEIYSMTHRIIRPDGQVRWVTERGKAIPGKNGAPGMLSGVVQDVTEQQLHQRRLKEQAALIEVVPDAIVSLALDGTILVWNKAAEDLYGWAAREAASHPAYETIYGHEQWRFRSLCSQALMTGSWHGELTQRTKSGSLISVESRWVLLKDEKGQPMSILTVNTDITEKKRLQRQFLRSQRMECIGTLAAGMAHDINNVLAPILMTLQLFRAKLTDPEDDALLDNLENSVRRGADLVKQALSFARGNELQATAVQARRIIEELARVLQETFPKNIELATTVPDDLWAVRSDPTHLYQILMNLCVNSRDAMPGGGQLTISADNIVLDGQFAGEHGAKAGPYVVLSVTDTGSGIPEADRARIFEPFFSTKPPGEGTGLGLSTVQALVRNHKGFIRFTSEMGKGTVMQAFLPAEESFFPSSVEAPSSYPRGDGELILVVDDEATIRIVAKTILENNGYQVLTAAEASEAVALVRRRLRAIKAVLTDLVMPGLDSQSAIDQILQLVPAMPIIAMSGAVQGEAQPKVSGAAAYLPKPFSAEKMLETLGSLVQRGKEKALQPP